MNESQDGVRNGLSVGVLIIGSLYWDLASDRKEWRASRLSVSNSSSGRRWKLDHAPAVGDPTHMVEFGTGRRAFAREA